MTGQLWAELVLADRASAVIINVETEEALVSIIFRINLSHNICSLTINYYNNKTAINYYESKSL